MLLSAAESVALLCCYQEFKEVLCHNGVGQRCQSFQVAIHQLNSPTHGSEIRLYIESEPLNACGIRKSVCGPQKVTGFSILFCSRVTRDDLWGKSEVDLQREDVLSDVWPELTQVRGAHGQD